LPASILIVGDGRCQPFVVDRRAHANRIIIGGDAPRQHGSRLSRPRSRVYDYGQLNGRSATWVTPTFLFERRR
jgi:hypothetical protein